MRTGTPILPVAIAALALSTLAGCRAGCRAGECAEAKAGDHQMHAALAAHAPAPRLAADEPLAARLFTVGKIVKPNQAVLRSNDHRQRLTYRVLEEKDDPESSRRFVHVAFGPNPPDGWPQTRGGGRLTNSEAAWEAAAGYAFMRGWRPIGTTDRVKFVSPSSTIILQVTRDYHLAVLYEGDMAEVSKLDGSATENLNEGEFVKLDLATGAFGPVRRFRDLQPGDPDHPVLEFVRFVLERENVKEILSMTPDRLEVPAP
jgi:hypothetical protein